MAEAKAESGRMVRNHYNNQHPLNPHGVLSTLHYLFILSLEGAKYGPGAKSSLLFSFVNKVLLEILLKQGHVHPLIEAMSMDAFML